MPSASALELTASHARRFLVARHLLAPPRSLPPSTTSVMKVVERLGSLQFDPLEVPGARNHDLVLHARIRGYRRAMCDALLYPPDARTPRLLFEAYNKSLNILPVSELPWHAYAWKRQRGRNAGDLLREHGDVARAILERLRSEGPLSHGDFDRSTKVQSYWGTPTTLSRHVLDALFSVGDVGIARREGNMRVYDRIDRLLPSALLKTKVSDEEAMRHRLLSRYRGLGLMGEGAGLIALGTGSTADRRRHRAWLVDAGILVPTRVEGVRGVRYVLAAEKGIVASTARASKRAPSVAWIAPLDPLLWDRALLRQLFGFDYIWEVYTPAEKRKHGYYVLPILFGARIVGRIEPRFDKKTSTLHVAGMWLETGIDLDDDGFVDAMRVALDAYGGFIGATRTTFARTKLVRAFARRSAH